MKKLLSRFWVEKDGALALEWVVLNSVLVIGAVAGISSVRDAVNDEMADMTEAIVSLDQSYVIRPPAYISVAGGPVAGGGYTQGMIEEGAGYSSAAWQEFMTKNSGYSSGRQGRTSYSQGHLGAGSGASGSYFIDHRPTVNREQIQMQVPPNDQAAGLDNIQ